MMSGLNNHFIFSLLADKELVDRWKVLGCVCTFFSLFADSYRCIVHWFPYEFHLCSFF